MCKLLSKTIPLASYPFSILEEVEEGCNSTAVNEDNPVEVVVVRDIALEAVHDPFEVSARNSAMEVVNSPVEFVRTLVAHTAQLMVAGRIPPEVAGHSFPVEAGIAAENNRPERHRFLVLVLVRRNFGLLEAENLTRL